MSDILENLSGVSPEVLKDPRIQEAAAVADGSADIPAISEAVLSGDEVVRIAKEKYGMDIRTPGLEQSATLAWLIRVFPEKTVESVDPETGEKVSTTERDCPDELQSLIWFWSLAAPERDVLKTIRRASSMKEDGDIEIITTVNQWYRDAHIPVEASREIMSLIAYTLSVAARMNAAQSQPAEQSKDVTVKKKDSLGTSKSLT